MNPIFAKSNLYDEKNTFLTSCQHNKKLKNLSSFGFNNPSNRISQNNIFPLKNKYNNSTFFNGNETHKNYLPNIKQKNSEYNKISIDKRRGYIKPFGNNGANRNKSVNRFFSTQIINDNFKNKKDNSFHRN